MGGREKQRIKGIMKIVLQNLTKKFPGPGKRGEDVVAVRDFNYEFPDGKLVGLLGPSGCGKSTTLFMICGLEKPTEGKIFFGQDNVTALAPEDRGVGVVFQNYALYPHLTVEQNILFPLQNLKGAQKLSKQEMQRRAEEAAHLVQIEKLMQRRPSELSGGQQQRVAIARALVNEPACCCWTSRFPTSMRGCACRPARRFAESSGKPASRRCSSRTIRRRP